MRYTIDCMDTTLRQSIISTLAYFDVFSYPLTAEELYRWVHVVQQTGDRSLQSVTYLELLEMLGMMVEAGEIETLSSFYVLPGRKEGVEKRNAAVPRIEEKLRIARRAIRLLRYVPFVYGVYVCNTLASGTVTDESDIDVFIILREGRMWTGRLLITVLLSVVRLRRTDRCVANRMCLSYYVTRDHLCLKDVLIDEEDIYTWYWIDQVLPVYDRDETFRLFQEQNAWVQDMVPRALQSVKLSRRYRVDDSRISVAIRGIGEYVCRGRMGDWFERVFRAWQRAFMDRHEKVGARPFATSVVISDTMLKFHENDRRGVYREEWRKRNREIRK